MCTVYTECTQNRFYRLIGDMRGVSQGYLEQTLDKKLMSNMRTKRNAHERMAGLVSSGEWSSGSRWEK